MQVTQIYSPTGGKAKELGNIENIEERAEIVYFDGNKNEFNKPLKLE